MKYLITGGAGSLGRALTHKIRQDPNSEVVVYSRDEGKHAQHFPKGSGVSTVIGDVRDFDRLNVTVKRHRPDFIIHAAALKRIDDIELQPEESIKTNVNGSENVARVALLNEIKKCMFISTDKACKPVNVYGSSKFIAERIFTNYDFNSVNTIFSSVRYGNVISSRGSFIPTWANLINSGKSINVTSLEMTRFMFTLNDAVKTVLKGIENCSGGEVFVPKISSFDMRTILLAIENLVGKKIDYDVTGLRPGEKLHEDMLSETELPYAFEVPNCNLIAIRPQYTAREHDISWEKYTGPVMNSSLHINKDVEILTKLIERGKEESCV